MTKLRSSHDHSVVNKTLQIFGAHLSATLPVNTGRNNPPGIAGTLTAGEEATDTDMHKRVAVAEYSYGGAGSCLRSYHYRIIGQETMVVLAKELESLLQARHYEWLHPEMKRTGDESGSIA